MESNRARLAVLLTAAVAVVVLFLVLSSGDEEGETTTAASTPATTTDGGAQADDKGRGEGKHAGHKRHQGRNDEPEEPALPTVVLRDGQPLGGVLKLSVTSGDEVRFAVDSDAPNEIHIHGYEIYEDINPGENVITFTADLEGAYEIETHVAPETQVAELEVNPG
jgi:hypothetical protein